MTLDHLSDSVKAAGDILSLSVVVGALTQMLPSVAAILTIIWTALRIYETRTIQRLLGKEDEA